jgi:hypothetical protein
MQGLKTKCIYSAIKKFLSYVEADNSVPSVQNSEFNPILIQLKSVPSWQMEIATLIF